MNEYTVEATLPPVTDSDWATYRSVTNIVPGTILIEDAEQPVLILPVEAGSPAQAAVFVEGVASIVGIRIVSGEIRDAPAHDFESPVDGDADQAPPVSDRPFVPRWLDSDHGDRTLIGA